MTEAKIVKIRWYDTQTSQGYTFEEAKEIKSAILTVYGELIKEDKNYLTIACYYDNDAGNPEETNRNIHSFFVEVVKKAIIERKEMIES